MSKTLAALAALLALASCDSGPAVVVSEACRELTPPDEPRIQWGEGVEGVRMGDSRAEVEARLGAPDAVGYVKYQRTQETLFYRSGDLAGLWVVTVNRSGGADDVGILMLNSESPGRSGSYRGRTEQGVGIGSTRAEAECAYGPFDPTADPVIVDTEDVRHFLFFRADTLRTLWMLDWEYVREGARAGRTP